MYHRFPIEIQNQILNMDERTGRLANQYGYHIKYLTYHNRDYIGCMSIWSKRIVPGIYLPTQLRSQLEASVELANYYQDHSK